MYVTRGRDVIIDFNCRSGNPPQDELSTDEHHVGHALKKFLGGMKNDGPFS